MNHRDRVIILACTLLAVCHERVEAAVGFHYVDISSACNMAFHDEVDGDRKGGFTDQGEINLGALQPGEVAFKGVRFNIIDPSRNKGKSCIVLRGDHRRYFPREASIPVKAKAAGLCFLHTCAWGALDRKPVAEYEILYEGGVRERLPIRGGIEVTDWSNWEEPDGSHKVWRGRAAQLGDVGLNLYVWANSHPARRIESITFRSLEAETIPALIAVSLSDTRLEALEKVPAAGYRSDQSRMVPFSPASFAEDMSGTALDFSFLLDPPAGKHGFVKARDGHFYFADGRRVKFWGVSFTSKANFMPKDMADKVAGHLAAMGFNLLRLHAFDGPNAIYEGSRASIIDGEWRKYHDENWDLLDYFVAQLKRRGIYVHLDILTGLMDAMMQHPDIVKEEGTTAHRLKRAAVFDPRMIELQKEYALDLFTHKNPYTGLCYKDDPVFSSTQVINEGRIWSYPGLPPHYLKALQKLWNQWLVEEYGTRDRLQKAWTDRDGNCALLSAHDPEAGTVPLPDLSAAKSWDRPYVGKPYRTAQETPNLAETMITYYARMSTDSIPFANDMSRFCYELQTRYETGMRTYLRSIGVKIPVMGSAVNGRLMASLKATAEMDFVNNHTYWDIANRWKGIIGNRNVPMVKDDPFDFSRKRISTVGFLSALRVRGRPSAALEWAHTFPNEFRAEGSFFMSAYGCLQDWDMLSHHSYTDQNNWRNRRIMWLAPFPDPAHIGPLHLAALLFLRGDVRVATTTVDTGFSEVDSHYLQSFGEKGNRLCSADWLGAISSVGNRFFSRSYDGDADVVIASGRSGSASYARAKHAIVFADNPWGDLCNKTGPDLTRPLLEISPDLEFEKSVDSVWSFTSVLNIGEPVEGVARVAMKVASLPRGATPFGLSPDSRLCLGYVDDRFCAISDIRLGVDSAPWFLYRVYRACAGHWNLPGAERLSPHEFVSDTGELRWNFRDGCLTIDTERSQGAAGFLRDRDILLRDVRITEVENEFSTFMLSSLDGLPLQSSARIVVLAIGKAENTGQHWLNRERTRLMGRKYEGVGTPPVLIDPVTAQITLKREHEAGMIEVHALDGAGRRTKRIEVKKQDGTVAFSIGREYSTIYYEIVSGPAAD